MRDIRNDLQERAQLIEEQISGAYAQFEKMIEQLQAEREGRVADLKSELGAVVKLLEAEHRRMANVLPIPTSQPTGSKTRHRKARSSRSCNRRYRFPSSSCAS